MTTTLGLAMGAALAWFTALVPAVVVVAGHRRDVAVWVWVFSVLVGVSMTLSTVALVLG